MAYEHLYWDQATLLSQIGVLSSPVPVAEVGIGAELSGALGDRGSHDFPMTQPQANTAPAPGPRNWTPSSTPAYNRWLAPGGGQ